MIYFDNAATGGFKPSAVTDAVNSAVKYLCANPGRSGHRLAVTGANIIYKCRERLSKTFGNDSAERVIFTKNCTEALNTAIFGFLGLNAHVITTVYEHNSVLRPLFSLQNRGLIKLDVITPSDGVSIADGISAKITSETQLVAMTAVSNVTGEALPVSAVGEICKKKGAALLVDGAQAAGHMPINMKAQNIDILCIPAHKGMHGIMGGGALLFRDGAEISPLTFGGTGTQTLSLSQPDCYPEKLESGTLNLPAIAALSEGAEFTEKNLPNFARTVTKKTADFIDAIKSFERVRCYSEPNASGIVSFEITALSSDEVADILSSEYDIAVRGGLHCAPLTHRFFGTVHNGLIRASFAAQNTHDEMLCLIDAVRSLTRN